MCLSCAQWVLWVTQANHSHWPHQGLQGICPWLLLFNPGPARPMRSRKLSPWRWDSSRKPLRIYPKRPPRGCLGVGVWAPALNPHPQLQLRGWVGQVILGVSFFSSYKSNLDFLILFPDYKIFANAGRHFQTPLGSSMISCGQWVL